MVGVRCHCPSCPLDLCWRVYDSSDSLRVFQSGGRLGGDVRQVQGQTSVDHGQCCCWNSVNFDVPICGGPTEQFCGMRLLRFLYRGPRSGCP